MKNPEQLIETLVKAVTDANKALEKYQTENFMKYFDSKGNPHTVKFNTKTEEITVAKACLVNHNVLKIRELNMDFKTVVDDKDINISIRLKEDNPPEAILKILEDILK